MTKIEKYVSNMKDTTKDIISTIPWLIGLGLIGYLITLGIPYAHSFFGY